MKIAIGIATAGRRAVLTEVLAYIGLQTRQPDHVFICPASDRDCDAQAIANFPSSASILTGGRGLTTQRNAILKAAQATDFVLFLDDDFIPERTFLEELERFLTRHPDTAVLTGLVLADGANGPGINLQTAIKTIEGAPALSQETIRAVYNGYGCNMAINTRLALAHGVMFDEKLPLYGWWEDVDFSRRLGKYGPILSSDRIRGVHMGVKSGRTPGIQLGYSQVINIAYMMQKGSVSPTRGSVRIFRNVFANLVRQMKSESWVDRRGRLRGNMLGFTDIMRGRIDPNRIHGLR